MRVVGREVLPYLDFSGLEGIVSPFCPTKLDTMSSMHVF